MVTNKLQETHTLRLRLLRLYYEILSCQQNKMAVVLFIGNFVYAWE